MGEEGAAPVAGTTLLKRLAAPEEIASGAAGFMTGRHCRRRCRPHGDLKRR